MIRSPSTCGRPRWPTSRRRYTTKKRCGKTKRMRRTCRGARDHLKHVRDLHVYMEQPEKMATDLIQHYKQYKESLANQLKADAPSICTVVLVNWAAPSLVCVAQQAAQVQLLNYIIADNENNLALTVNPVFSYKRGQVWLQGHALMKLCATTGNLNVNARLHHIQGTPGPERWKTHGVLWPHHGPAEKGGRRDVEEEPPRPRDAHA